MNTNTILALLSLTTVACGYPTYTDVVRECTDLHSPAPQERVIEVKSTSGFVGDGLNQRPELNSTTRVREVVPVVSNVDVSPQVDRCVARRTEEVRLQRESDDVQARAILAATGTSLKAVGDAMAKQSTPSNCMMTCTFGSCYTTCQ